MAKTGLSLLAPGVRAPNIDSLRVFREDVGVAPPGEIIDNLLGEFEDTD